MTDLGFGKGISIPKDANIASGKFITYLVHPTFTADGQLVDKLFVETQNLWDLSSNVIRTKTDGVNLSQYSLADAAYPVRMDVNIDHDDVHSAFDSYYDGADWKSSSSSTNGRISKTASHIRIDYDSGVTPGDNITWSNAFNVNLLTGGVSLASGTSINEISTDGTFAASTDNQASTSLAIDTRVSNNIANGMWSLSGGVITSATGTSSLSVDVTTLDAATYGDLENTGWVGLKNGDYSMAATSAQLSNAPFEIEAAQNYYIFITSGYKVISTVPYVTQVFHVFKDSVSGEAPLAYHRSFKTDIADFSARGFKGENSVQAFASINSTSGLTFALTAGNEKNLMEFLLESGEGARLNEGFKLLDTAGNPLGTFLDETNDKFIFPSNFKTAGNLFCPYTIRVKISGTVPNPAEADVEFNVRLRRSIDDSIISTQRIIKVLSTTLDEATLNFSTFVNTEVDPYVVDGMYIDIFSPVGSKTLTITDVSILVIGTF